jgi:putative tryptophan/tyrosine transport system substrate-binding protein
MARRRFRFEARGPSDYQRVFGDMASQKIGALVLHEDTLLNANAAAIAGAAAAHHLPSCGFPEFALVGGFMAYGVNLPELDRRAAAFIDKILKGAKPGDLPLERATKFTATVNLRTARTLRLTIPPSVLARADQVIE